MQRGNKGMCQPKNQIMKRILISACIVFSFYACTKNGETNDLPPALKEVIRENSSCTCLPYLAKYEWQEKTVYLLGSKGPACQTIPLYYDENGNKINLPTNYTYDNFSKDAKLIGIVWECLKNS